MPIVQSNMQKERGSHDCLSLHSSHYAYLVLYFVSIINTFLTFNFSIFSRRGSNVAAGYNIPVDNLPKLLESIEPAVAVVDIIGMLPHIEDQQRCQTLAERIAGV